MYIFVSQIKWHMYIYKHYIHITCTAQSTYNITHTFASQVNIAANQILLHTPLQTRWTSPWNIVINNIKSQSLNYLCFVIIKTVYI